MEELFSSCFLFLRGEVISFRERSIRADNAARSAVCEMWIRRSTTEGARKKEEGFRGEMKQEFHN